MSSYYFKLDCSHDNEDPYLFFLLYSIAVEFKVDHVLCCNMTVAGYMLLSSAVTTVVAKMRVKTVNK